MEEFREQEIDIRKYLSILYKRRWIIIAIFGIVLFVGVIRTLRAIPIYSSTARILIEIPAATPVSVDDIFSGSQNSWMNFQNYYPTQQKIISSRAVAAKVIKKLDLENSEEFSPKPKDDFISNVLRSFYGTIGTVKSWVSSILKSDDQKQYHHDSFDSMEEDQQFDVNPYLVSSFVGRIQVQQVEESRLFDVSVMARNPWMAARMTNSLVEAYIEHNLETKLQSVKDAVRWLQDRIDEERKKVESAEIKLLKYKTDQGMVTELSEDIDQVNAEKLARLEAQVVSAESQRVEAETRYQQAIALENTPDQLDSIPEVLRNEIIQQIKKMEVDLYNRMSELSKRYGKNHPKIVAIHSELEELQKRKVQEVQQVVNSLKNEYKLALAREQSLKNALEKERSKTLAMNRKAIEYSVLKRQAESSRQMYDMLIKRFKQTSLTEEMKTANVRVIDRAQPRLFPVKPNTKRNIMLAALVGLMMGVGLSFFLEYLDNTIKLPDEIDQYLNIPFLGAIPAYVSKNGNKNIDVVALNEPKSIISESLKGVRTALLFSSAEQAPTTILITSAGAKEGKTFCAANLAITMAQSGSKVVILDCDMRRPRLHRIFNAKREVGMSNFLVGTGALKDALIPTPVENLDFIPVGPIPPNPSEILGSNKMTALIEALKKKYDRIIIDSPPTSAVTDASILSSKADGVVLVIRAGDTPRNLVQTGLSRLNSVNAHILGAVLNGVKAERDGYYYYQYYYYSYYGDEEPKRRKKKHS